MAKEKLTQMDIYGDYRTPLPLATFCRGHKYTPEAVALGRALRAEDDARAALRLAELQYESAENFRKHCQMAAQKRMDDSDVV